jgi:methylamine dehydrogenase accessory protein MauD
MNTLLLVSYIGLWVLTIVLVAAVCVLARQVGLLHRRITPAGAMMDDTGPPIGAVMPAIAETDIFGREATVREGWPTLLVFMSPHCSVCGELMPAVRAVARGERGTMNVLLVSLYQDVDTNRKYLERYRSLDLQMISSPDFSLRYKVTSPPFALVLGPNREVRSKGLVNTLEHLESLLNALDVGLPTLEAYLNGQIPSSSEPSPAVPAT